MRVNGNIVLNDNASGEIRHVYIERLDATAEAAVTSTLTAANTGRLIFNTTTKQYKFWNGAAFTTLTTAESVAAVKSEVDAVEASLGGFINADGTFTATALDALMSVDLSTAKSLADILIVLDKAITDVDVSAQLAPMKTEIDAIEAGAGLGADGTYAADAATTYITAATSLKDADKKLDAAVKALSDSTAADKVALEAEITTVSDKAVAIQTEVDAIEAGAGLGANGTYAADAATTYIAAATSLKDADKKLDAAVKVNADAISDLTTDVAGKQAALGFVPLNKAGDSSNGNLSFGGTSTVKNLTAPVDTGDAVRKIDLDNAIAGIARDFQADILGVEGDFVDVPGRYVYADGSKFTSGVAASAGDIVVVDATGSIAELAYDVSVEGPGALTWNRHTETWFQWNGTTWGIFGGLSGVNAGVGLEKSGNTIAVRLGAGVADLPSGEVGLDLKVDGGLQLVDPTSGAASTDAEAVLTVKVGTGLEVTADGIEIKDGGVTAKELAASVAGNGLAGGAGSALSIKTKADSILTVTAEGIDIDTTSLDSKFLHIDGGTLTGPLVLAADATDAKGAATKGQVDGSTKAAADALADAVAKIDATVDSVVASLNKTSFVHDYTDTGATAAISVVHGLGVKYCNVTVVDADDEVFIPQSIKFIDENTLTVTLNSDITGKVVVSGHATLVLA